MTAVTVLTAVYNASPWLRRCLDSLLGQTLRDIQIIAIDDASTDDSWQILCDYARRDDRLQPLHLLANGGQAAARNLGLSMAVGEYICMVDADDWLSADALERAYAVATAHERTDAVLFRLMLSYPDGSEHPYPMPADIDEGSVLTGIDAMCRSLDWHIHGLYIVRRNLHMRYPYDNSCRLYSDDNTTRLHYLHSREVRFSSGEYHYFQNPASTTLGVSARYFLCLPAEEHMRQLLIGERQQALSQSKDATILSEAIVAYERHRWLRVADCCYYLYCHRRAFAPTERKEARDAIRHARTSVDFSAVPRSLRRKFGYRRCGSFALFFLQEQLYFTLRKLTGRL